MVSQVVFTIPATVEIPIQKLTAMDLKESPIAKCLEKNREKRNENEKSAKQTISVVTSLLENVKF